MWRRRGRRSDVTLAPCQHMWKLNKLKYAVEDKQCNAYAEEFKTTPKAATKKIQSTSAEIADRRVRNVNKYVTSKKQMTFVY